MVASRIYITNYRTKSHSLCNFLLYSVFIVIRDCTFKNLFVFTYSRIFCNAGEFFCFKIFDRVSVYINLKSTPVRELSRDSFSKEKKSSLHVVIVHVEILSVSIRSDQDIKGILVDKEEIKVGLLADDLTAFLRNDISLLNFLRCVDIFGACSGRNINYDKSEILLLGDLTNSALEYTLLQNITVKKSINLLGVHFTYNHIAKRKLNFDDLIISIKKKN